MNNKVRIAAGHFKGAHFPEAQYDNNTVVVALVAGWIGPAIVVSIMGAFRAMRSEQRTPEE